MRSALVLSLALALAGPVLAAEAAEAAPAEPAWKAELQKKLGKKISLDFADTPLDEVLGFVQTLTGAPIVVDPAVKAEVAKAKVTLRVTDKALSAALARMLRPAGLEHRLMNHAVLVTKPGAPDPAFGSVRAAEGDPEAKKAILARLEQKVSFEFTDTPYDQAVTFIREVAQVGMILDPAVLGENPPRVSLSMENVPLRVVLDWITWLGGLKWEVRDRLYITAPAPGEKVAPAEAPAPEKEVAIRPAEGEERPRPGKAMAVEFVETPAGQCIDFIRATAGVNIVVHPDCGERLKTPITLRVKGMSHGQVLDWVMRLARLKHELKDGVIFITPAE